jgi:hypothetical protein
MRSSRFTAAALALALLAGATSVSAQSQEAIAQARFGKGRELFLAQKYDAALAEFRAATELFESPNTRLYIARCERELGHYTAAYVEFQRAGNEAADRAKADPRYTVTRDSAKQEAAAIEGKLGHVTVLAPNAPQGATFAVNGTPLAGAGLGYAAPIDPGRVMVTAQAPGYLPFKRGIDVAAGEGVEITVKLEVDPNAKKPEPVVETGNETGTGTGTGTGTNTVTVAGGTETTSAKVGGGVRIAGFVIGGLGIAGVGTFGVLAGLAQSKFDALKNECGGRCDASYESKIHAGETLQTAANITLGAGLGVLLVGTIMIAAGGPHYVSVPKEPAEAARLWPTFSVGKDGFSLGVGRAF